jgi:hypothetical protein
MTPFHDSPLRLHSEAMPAADRPVIGVVENFPRRRRTRRERTYANFVLPEVKAPIAVARTAVHHNPGHHLWNNHGTWFMHYTSYLTPFTKERVRFSLKTASFEEAQRRRDLFFASIQTQTKRT